MCCEWIAIEHVRMKRWRWRMRCAFCTSAAISRLVARIFAAPPLAARWLGPFVLLPIAHAACAAADLARAALLLFAGPLRTPAQTACSSAVLALCVATLADRAITALRCEARCALRTSTGLSQSTSELSVDLSRAPWTARFGRSARILAVHWLHQSKQFMWTTRNKDGERARRAGATHTRSRVWECYRRGPTILPHVTDTSRAYPLRGRSHTQRAPAP